MWDLDTINRINQVAARLARAGRPEREALYIATQTRDPQFNRVPDSLPPEEVASEEASEVKAAV